MGTEADFSLGTVIKMTKNTLGKVKNKPKVKIKQTKIMRLSQTTDYQVLAKGEMFTGAEMATFLEAFVISTNWSGFTNILV